MNSKLQEYCYILVFPKIFTVDKPTDKEYTRRVEKRARERDLRKEVFMTTIIVLAIGASIFLGGVGASH